MTEGIPTKRIISRAHLDAFLSSETHADVVAFVEKLNESVVGVKLTDPLSPSASVKAVCEVLDEVERVIDETPALDNGGSRFGNPAFKQFYDKVAAKATSWHEHVPGMRQDRVNELSVYFCESWGNRTRVDYGSGMELNFIAWLLCLHKIGVLKDEDSKEIVLAIFWQYMRICRTLQTKYWLEPAGSHGAQGLDDYHFAVFIFGSAQLRGHKYLRPKSIHDPEILEEFGKDYMYFAYINYINSIKTASLRWHSPMLDDISAVKTWDKINSGMIKMYKGEVLAKLPVAQHFLFGSLLPFPSVSVEDEHGDGQQQQRQASVGSEDADVHVDEHGHLHVRGEGFGDCCGIPIPSAFAAAAEEQKKHQRSVPLPTTTAATSGSIRRIPFD